MMDKDKLGIDNLSLLRDIDDDKEENKDLVILTIECKQIQIHYSQLCKYSQLIRENYLISDVKNRLSQELIQFQQENGIKTNNIILFFQLFDEEEISISNDKYKDLFKLSQFFKIPKLIKQLKIYFKSHINDADLIIRLFINEIEEQNNTEKINFELKSIIEQVIIDKIDDCLQNENFHRIPISFIYQIFERIDKEKLTNDYLFNFIKQSPEELFVFLKFLKIEKLTKSKFDEFCNLFLYSKQNVDFLQYLPCNLEYIIYLKSVNETLELEKNKIESENIELSKEVAELKDQIELIKNDKNLIENKNLIMEEQMKQFEINLNILKEKNIKIEAKNKLLEDENSKNQLLIKQLNEEKLKLQNQIKNFEQKQKDCNDVYLRKLKGKTINYTGNPFSGIFNYLKTKSGDKRSPISDSELSITVSSNDSSDPRDVTNGSLESLFKPYFNTENLPNSWIRFNFKSRKVILSGYTIQTIRGNPNHFYPKSWVIEGSNNNSTWTTLDTQNDSSFLNGNHVIHTFTIPGKKEKEFQYIRMRLTGPNWNGSNHLGMESFELFGTLVKYG